MKKLFVLLLLPFFAIATKAQTYFASYPTLTPDGQTVIYSFEGDLWKADVRTGQSFRLTGMEGEEIYPRVSPDGKWVAFSSNQFGNYDVYVMPLNGGNIKQLTWSDAADQVDNWSWDSKQIYFTSNRYNLFGSYKVNINGGTAQRLFPGYFTFAHNAAEAPSGDIYFSDSWESYMFPTRTRYKGDFNPDIQSYNPKTKAFKQHTTYNGKDLWQTVDKNGNVFFVSDEWKDKHNLYTLKDGKSTRMTSFDSSVKRPFVSADGSRVVFEKDYQLYIYDTKTGNSELIPLQVYRNNILSQAKEFNVKGRISNFDVSPDGEKIAFISRGEIFISDITGKFIEKLNKKGAERAMEVKWLADNRTLLFNQTYNGYQNLYTINAADGSNLKQLTKENRNNRSITLDKDRKQAAYVSGRDEIRLLEVKSGASKTIVKDEIWAIQNGDPSFSPDGEWLMYNAKRNFEDDIFIYNLKSGKIINLTNTAVSENSPTWAPDGKSIYFTSSRTSPSYPRGGGDEKLYRIPLNYYDDPYKSDKFNELFKEEPKDSTDNKKNDKKRKPIVKKEDKKTPAPIKINLEDIMYRLEVVGPTGGSQDGVVSFANGSKTYVFYMSDHEGKRALYRTIIEPFESNKTEKVTDSGISDMISVGGKYYILANGQVQTYNLEGNNAKGIETDYKFTRNLSDEFTQMFYETWAGVQENFYDENFHNTDWEGIKKEYEKYLPFVTNRTDLRMLLGDMLNELNSSHMGFSSSGAEEKKSLTNITNETGIMFEDARPFVVKYIVPKSNAYRESINVKPGDMLVSVNGQRVDENTDRDYYFTSTSLSKEMELEFQGGKKVKIHPQNRGSIGNDLYNEWITNNRKRVDKLSNNRIAYSHMKDMSNDQLQVFLTDMMLYEQNKDGIILDLRYNRGGNVHDAVLQFLSQRAYMKWKYREGKLAIQPNFTPATKPIVLLINEQSLSDAEVTANGFRTLKLGKIIGTETYRWIIFTSGNGLVDGSFYRLPSWGCYTLDGKDLEHTGVAPDIYVKNTFEDKINNRDPQLERAVREILGEMR